MHIPNYQAGYGDMYFIASPVPAFLPSPQKCHRNEFYKACVSSTCGEKRCGRKGLSSCIEDCASGCFCADGYFRSRVGTCVKDCRQDVPGLQFQRPYPGIPTKAFPVMPFYAQTPGYPEPRGLPTYPWIILQNY
ncbi:hypothetical protein HPB48_008114 [Haemaphysalis longicornis]|uniref:TIL domain-containing protein n=1 Tax=Haemaphysalis longicornis TaxID=44386 RepID=A0A9J6FSG7_HAELO|nr:hypothetical protein HPB48_008114 [Haemaphysalis longicornis]